MPRFKFVSATLLLVTLFGAVARGEEGPDDPFLWLEEVQGKKALAWVEEQNAASKAELTKHPAFAEIEANTLAILEAKDRIVRGTRHGAHVYNFWRDATNPRGLYRRATCEAYLAGKPAWDVLLDLDALAKKEEKNWVFKGMELLHPSYKLGLMRLSIGGSDAVVIREFNLETKRFVEDGFQLPEGKSSLDWIDADTVFVATDFGPGSMTDSGYARIIKRWKRGTPLADAKVIFEGKKESVSAGAGRSHYGDTHQDWIYHSTSFYESEKYLLEGDKLTLMDLPGTARVHTYYDGLLFVELKRDWKLGDTTHPQGTILTVPLMDLKAGKQNVTVFLKPSETRSVQSVTRTKSYLLVQVMEDVRDVIYRFHQKDGAWVREVVPFEGQGTIRPSSVDVDHDTFFTNYSSFLQPSTLFYVDAATLTKKVVQQGPQRFDPKPYVSEQKFAKSKDGTRVPYFVVRRKDLECHGKNRTLLYGYGGFRQSLRPFYMGSQGNNWLARGGVYVVANIRGGGEYGPRWHNAALRENRHKAFEDFEAVAEDLIAQKITTSKYLGIRGGSNGGLLVGAAFTRRPELYGAVVCQVPLLDMRRYNKLLAGASWMAEYGNPDVPGDWTFIKTYSPYHHVKKDVTYPRVLFTTSTRDDRVHPGHARKMVALMKSMGHPVLYYENTEGGHAGAANAKQRAFAAALATTYLLTELGE